MNESWKECLVEVVTTSGGDLGIEHYRNAEVMLRDDELVISYHTDNGYEVYRGNGTHGHWDLHNAKTGGWSSAHRTPDSEPIEGLWQEGSSSGYWKVRLVKPVNQREK
jgi:hypothetical protein